MLQGCRAGKPSLCFLVLHRVGDHFFFASHCHCVVCCGLRLPLEDAEMLTYIVHPATGFPLFLRGATMLYEASTLPPLDLSCSWCQPGLNRKKAVGEISSLTTCSIVTTLVLSERETQKGIRSGSDTWNGTLVRGCDAGSVALGI